ncbi:MAG: hypothetical protein ACI8P3_000196 [Saprospiraceae bacterium]|jgi:hypothetical protein
MKNIFFCLTLLCLPLSIFSQANSIEKFYQKYKSNTEVTSINLSGQLLNFVFSGIDRETGKQGSKISNLRVLIVEEGAIVKHNDYQQFIKNVKNEDFEELMRVKDGDEAIDFHLREVGDMITDVLITVKGKDGFILLSLEGLFNFEDLNDLNLNIEGGEHLKKLPEKKKDLQRA